MSENVEIKEEKPQKKKRLKQLMRTFNVDDAVFIEKNTVIRALFNSDMPFFAGFDPSLDAVFTTAWAQHIETCLNHPTDAVVISEQQITTAAQQKAIADLGQKVNDLEYFVKKAFPANPALWEEFAFSKRQRVLASVPHFVLWAFTMFMVLEYYETQLLAAGMPAGFKSEFDTLCGDMADSELQQEFAKRTRLRQTRLRVEQLNRLHQYLQRVQNAAQVVFANDEVKRKQYA